MEYSFEINKNKYISSEWKEENSTKKWVEMSLNQQVSSFQILKATQAFLIAEKQDEELVFSRVVAFKKSERNYKESTGEKELTLEVREDRPSQLQVVLSPFYKGLKTDHKKKAYADTVKSPITGKVLQVFKKNGERVKAKEPILTVEAMKMENAILAPQEGELECLDVNCGDNVVAQQVLFKIK